MAHRVARDAAPAPSFVDAVVADAPADAVAALATLREERFDDLVVFDGSRTRQRWLVTREGVWEPRAWQVLEASPRRAARGGALADPSTAFVPLADAHANQGECRDGMVEVAAGAMVAAPDDEVLARQDAACLAWREIDAAPEDARCADPLFRATEAGASACACWHPAYRAAHYAACVCLRYDAAAYARALAAWRPPTRALASYCVDRYEFPDVPGEYPVVNVTFDRAEALCALRGARLCTEHEWTFACEGPAARPFATGFELDPAACNVARPQTAFHAAATIATAAATGEALARDWQGLRAGADPRCASPSGVVDMAGNVDEWTRSDGRVDARARRWASILKGGYWAEQLNRCRVSTRAHDEQFAFYQIGFRCCRSLP